MKMEIKLILEYKHFFNSEPPENRLTLIYHIPKVNLLFEIARLNYSLKPYNSLKYNTSLEMQSEELRYFCPIDDELHKQYVQIASNNAKSRDEYPLIFNRAANLFALEEILNCSEFPEDEDFNMGTVEVWDAIFKYLLAVNTEISRVKETESQSPTIESISASSIVLNELMIEDNPFFIVYKGIKLIEFLSKNATYGIELERYFNEVLKIESDQFFFNLMSLSMANGKQRQFEEFVYHTIARDEFLDYLSENRIENTNPITLLSIKKTPFYKVSDIEYIILDINFLVNKSYNFFINDFWFDYLKPQRNSKGKEKFNYQDYRGVFGLFFESYIRDIFENSFKFLENPKPLFFDDLEIKTSAGNIEVADIYVRENEKILIGQVKSNSIYDKEKYGGDINILYRENREQFFIDFGVNQIFSSIRSALRYSEQFDSELPINGILEFYPIIVVNEKIFQTPLMSNLLCIRFQELLQNEDFGQHKIYPLVVMHVSDIEYLENSLSNKKVNIWDLLKSHQKKTSQTIMPPFILSADEFINIESITERVKTSLVTIVEKYSNDKDCE